MFSEIEKIIPTQEDKSLTNRYWNKLSPDDKDKYIIEECLNVINCNLITKKAEYTCSYTLKRISDSRIVWYSRFDNNSEMELISVCHSINGKDGGPEFTVEKEGGSKTIRIEIPNDIDKYNFTIKYTKKFSISEVSSIGKNKRLLVHFFFSYASVCNSFSANLEFNNSNLLTVLTPANTNLEKNKIVINQNQLSANQFIPITALIDVGLLKFISFGDKLLWSIISAVIGLFLGLVIK